MLVLNQCCTFVPILTSVFPFIYLTFFTGDNGGCPI